jgi:uncharacterized protein (DUF488 family)
VGHGARSLDRLLAVLAEGGVARVADVRRYPGSRRHPHFGRAALEESLPAAGVAYEWWGDELGGRRKPVEPSRHPEWRDPSFRAFADHMDTPEFAAALDRLLAGAGRTPTAVMCAETLWWKCHRRLIADAVAARGVEVVHLLDVGTRQAHPETLA